MTRAGTDLVGAFHLDSLDGDVGAYVFLREHERRGHAHLVQRDLGKSVADTVLPASAVLLHTVDAGSRRDVLADADGVLVLLRVWRADAEVWASAPSTEAARAVAEGVVAKVDRTVEERRVEVVFRDGESGSRTVALRVRPWAEIAALYPAPVRHALDSLMPHVHDVDEPRRLIVWYGAPGTGKTTAVRALMHAWRSWADPVVVTDPERLMEDGKYLRRVVFDGGDQDEPDRWLLVVLEDAEALLRSGSKGLGRLLNLSDGLLGQGLRCLFLVTTNEPLGALHPAVARPGRCLARVEFGPLDGGRTLAEVMAARAVTVTADAAVGQYL